ncbi:MAG: hypothetical protein ABIK96_05195 [bacterium]
MKKVYICPHCDAVLNPSVKILLTIGCRKNRGLILLSPQPGNFKFICDEKIEACLKTGEAVKFSCPVCHEDLTSPSNKNFARLTLVVPGAKNKYVEFSRVYGQHATFVISEDEVMAFGEDVDNLGKTNFFGA